MNDGHGETPPEVPELRFPMVDWERLLWVMMAMGIGGSLFLAMLWSLPLTFLVVIGLGYLGACGVFSAYVELRDRYRPAFRRGTQRAVTTLAVVATVGLVLGIALVIARSANGTESVEYLKFLTRASAAVLTGLWGLRLALAIPVWRMVYGKRPQGNGRNTLTSERGDE